MVLFLLHRIISISLSYVYELLVVVRVIVYVTFNLYMRKNQQFKRLDKSSEPGLIFSFFL